MSRQRGTVVRSGDTWRLRLRFARTPGGPRRHVSHLLGTTAEIPTAAAARRAADRLLEQLALTRISAATPMTWVRWCEVYMSRHLVLLARGTRRVRTSIIQRHLRLALALRRKRVHEITADDCQRFVVDQRVAGVASSTIRSHFALVRRMLRAAAAEGLAAQPPSAAQIQFPRDEVMRSTVRHKAFLPDEVRMILSTAEEPLRTACALARGLGLRASEVVGLTWSCIDLATGRVDIRQQALDGVLRPLKSQASQAVIVAAPELVEELRRYRNTMKGNSRGLLFASQDGQRPMDARLLRRQLHRLLARLEIRRRGFHGLRHAFAIAMADAAVSPEALRRAMRHASLRVTAVYLNASSEDVAAAVRAGQASVNCSRTVPKT